MAAIVAQGGGVSLSVYLPVSHQPTPLDVPPLRPKYRKTTLLYAHYPANQPWVAVVNLQSNMANSGGVAIETIRVASYLAGKARYVKKSGKRRQRCAPARHHGIPLLALWSSAAATMTLIGGKGPHPLSPKAGRMGCSSNSVVDLMIANAKWWRTTTATPRPDWSYSRKGCIPPLSPPLLGRDMLV